MVTTIVIGVILGGVIVPLILNWLMDNRIPNVGLGALEIKWLNFTIVLGEWVTRAAEKGE